MVCDRCGRSSYVPDDLVQGRAFRARCPDCQSPLEIPAERPSALDDGDLAWLSSDAKAPALQPKPEPKPVVTEQTVAAFERKAGAERRRHGVFLAAGALLAVAAAASVLLFISARMGERSDAAKRARESSVGDATATYDASGLLAKPEAPQAATAPQPARKLAVERNRGPRLRRDDRKLLDLLAKKDDVTVVAPEGDSLDSAQTALDPAAVERTIAGNRKAFDACVTRVLRLNPNLRVARRATLVVTVQPSGTVTGAFVAEEEVDRSDLGTCLSAAARRMVFPPFEGEAIDVSMPLSLSAMF